MTASDPYTPDNFDRWSWEMRCDQRRVGRNSELGHPRCGICGINLFAAYRDEWEGELECQACIEAAPHREKAA